MNEIKNEKWFQLLEPLIVARKLRPKPEDSKLIKVLNQHTGIRTCEDVKKLIELALKNVDSADSMFSRTSQIKTDEDPDGVIDDMFGELRAVPYLLHKGFKNISYCRREDVDFVAEFDNNVYYIEVAYLRGPSFKTQQIACTLETTQQPLYILDSKKLVSRLKSIYDTKEKQIFKHGYNETNSIIFIISDLEEIYEPWLSHDKIKEEHPILRFILTRKIPTVVFGPSSVYEPEASSLGGAFGKLNHFNYDRFNSNQF